MLPAFGNIQGEILKGFIVGSCIRFNFFLENRSGNNPVCAGSNVFPCFFHLYKKGCFVFCTAIRVAFPINIIQNIGSCRGTASSKALPLGFIPVLITSAVSIPRACIGHSKIFLMRKRELFCAIVCIFHFAVHVIQPPAQSAVALGLHCFHILAEIVGSSVNPQLFGRNTQIVLTAFSPGLTGKEMIVGGSLSVDLANHTLD